MMRVCAFAVSVACLAVTVLGHGRLAVPKTRKHVASGSDVYENDPVSGSTGADFACRNDPGAVPAVNTFTAGQSMTVKWNLSAAHVGDCALYISYDYDKRGADRANMKFFKIANWRDCKSINGQDQTVQLPSWLPAGRAVVRWDWYALHVFPTIEFYAQCADSNIIAGPKSLASPAQVPSYSVVDFYPPNGEQNKFRNPWASPKPMFFTGPPCACRNSPQNNCPLSTDTSSPGYLPVQTLASCDGGEPVPTAPNTPRPTPPPVRDQTTPTPTVTLPPSENNSPTAPPTENDTPTNCPAVCQTCKTYNDATCTQWCSQWNYCGVSEDHKLTDCRACGNVQVPSPTPGPTPAPTVIPTAGPPTAFPVEAPTPGCVDSKAGLPKGKSTKNKKFRGDVCACFLKCSADKSKGDNKAFGFSAQKKQCICYYKPKSKKGSLKTSKKGDYVYGELTQ